MAEGLSGGIAFHHWLTFTSNRATAIPQGEVVRSRNKAPAVCVQTPQSEPKPYSSNGLV